MLRRFLGLTALLAVCAVLGLGAYAWAQGVRPYMVRTGSMMPTLRPGDLVIDRPVAANTVLQVGDIITFHPQPQTTETHRIASFRPSGIVTKGDANRSTDVGEIQQGMVVGQVALIVPYGGYVAYYFQQPTGIASLILFFLAIYLAMDLIEPPGQRRQAPPGPSRRRPGVVEWPSGPLPESIAPRSIGGRA
jgi:signal peptidase I